MKSPLDMKNNLLNVIEEIQSINALATQFPPGTIMEGVGDAKQYAIYNVASGDIIIRTEVKGTQHEGRSERIEYIKEGAEVSLERDPNNPYDSNAISIKNLNGESLGNMDATLAGALSPLIDAGLAAIESAKVSYVEPLSQRGGRAKKAILYIEMHVKLEDIKVDFSNGCVVCVLGGDQMRGWAQELTIYKCNIPLADAKGLFELYNRYHCEFDDENPDDRNPELYAGLDNLADEIRFARRKMYSDRNSELKYDKAVDSDEFGEYVVAMSEKEPERYGQLVKYLDTENLDGYYENRLDSIFSRFAIDKESYYWLDQTRVDSSEWNNETMGGFNHWYEVIELYANDEDIPFDLTDEDVVSIFGFEKFEAFADLSYGC